MCLPRQSVVTDSLSSEMQAEVVAVDLSLSLKVADVYVVKRMILVRLAKVRVR